MNIDFLEKEIERFKEAIKDDEKKIELIKQDIRYYKSQLRNAENFRNEISKGSRYGDGLNLEPKP